MSNSPRSTGCPSLRTSGSRVRSVISDRRSSNRCTINSTASSRPDSTSTISGKPKTVQPDAGTTVRPRFGNRGHATCSSPMPGEHSQTRPDPVFGADRISTSCSGRISEKEIRGCFRTGVRRTLSSSCCSVVTIKARFTGSDGYRGQFLDNLVVPGSMNCQAGHHSRLGLLASRP